MRETFLFLGQSFRRWRTTGAVAPSGRALATAMADSVGEVADGQVILELGPGTGVFTRELVRRFPHARVVAVEVNPVFASRLATAAPGVTVVTGCAADLESHLTSLGLARGDVAAVVSGLPLLSLPDDLPRRVLASVASALPAGRPYVQFTYSGRAWQRFDVSDFQRRPPRRVWLNFPPAVILSFVRDQRTDSVPPPPAAIRTVPVPV